MSKCWKCDGDGYTVTANGDRAYRCGVCQESDPEAMGMMAAKIARLKDLLQEQSACLESYAGTEARLTAALDTERRAVERLASRVQELECECPDSPTPCPTASGQPKNCAACWAAWARQPETKEAEK